MNLPPFQGFMDTYKRDVYRFLVASIGPDDADDCFQETFLSALKAYRDLKSDQNLRGWIFTIAHRKVVDAARSRKARPVPTDAAPDGVDEHDGGPAWIWDRVALLPEKQRLAILHRYASQMTFKQVAEQMGISEAAARKNVSDGVRAMRGALVR